MSASIPRKPVRREEDRLVGRAGRAHRSPGSGEVADEAVGPAALDAALEVRDVAGEPQQLELERERERIERGTSARAGRNRIHGGEEPRQRLERALVALLLDEEPQHRLGADEPDREAVRILARGPVRVDERDAGDRVQLAGSLVEHQLDVRERLEPRAEARLRLAHALRHRADPPALAPCTGGGRDRPRRSGTTAARPPPSCASAPCGQCRRGRAEPTRSSRVDAARRPTGQRLAARAEPGAAAADARLRDRRSAARARLAVAAVDAELVLHRARGAVRRGVVAQRRALALDTRAERGADRPRAAARPRRRESSFAGRSGLTRARQSASSA